MWSFPASENMYSISLVQKDMERTLVFNTVAFGPIKKKNIPEREKMPRCSPYVQ